MLFFRSNYLQVSKKSYIRLNGKILKHFFFLLEENERIFLNCKRKRRENMWETSNYRISKLCRVQKRFGLILGSFEKIIWQQIFKGIMDMGGVRQRPAGLW